MTTPNRLITLAIHTFEKAQPIKTLLENEGIYVELNNVNLAAPETSPGVRIRISEADLPLALRIVENIEIFAIPDTAVSPRGGKVLIPVDFSPLSHLAAGIGMRLAASLKADAVFLHAFISPQNSDVVQLSDTYDYELADIDATRRLRQQAESLMKRFAAEVRQQIKSGALPAVKFTTQVEEGLPEEAILEQTRNLKPAMLVMATRSAGKKEAELIGSVTAEVLDSCRVPAFTIPENADPALLADISNVAFFCNLDQEDMLALDALYRLFPNRKLHVTLVHIPSNRWHYRSALTAKTAAKAGIKTAEEINQEAGERLLEYCRKHFEGYTFSLRTLDLRHMLQDVNDMVASNPFNLFCCPNKHKNVFARVFNPGLAHKILFRADVPMMTIPV